VGVHRALDHRRLLPATARRWAGVRVALVLALLAALVLAPGLEAASDPLVPPVSTTGSPPACRIADVRAKFPSPADWSRTLLDWRWRLPAAYRPPNLVPVSRAGLTGGGYVRAATIPNLKAMATAARAAGARLAVASAYRSYASQVSTFNSWVARFGYATAILGSARPGHSEHQLGTTIDFKSYGAADPWAIRGYNWARSRAGAWMMRNAWRYGFVLSYPEGKRSQVCYGYEPWHYRYYGRTVARAIHASGLTPRVWLWRHGNSPGAAPTPSPTATPRPQPTATPTPPPQPTATPTAQPTAEPTASPTPEPTTEPTTPPDPTPAP
jgi:D-alanyl-D-alanine carboxypeptidase